MYGISRPEYAWAEPATKRSASGRTASSPGARYVMEKAARRGIQMEWLDERYSTKTCSHCGFVQPTTPRGRRFRCAGCGVNIHRDVNGASNICSKGTFGVYGQVQADTVKYLRPIGVAPPTRATSR